MSLFDQVSAARELEEQHGCIVTLISIEHPDLYDHRPGVLCQVTPEIAARTLLKRTHRIATQAETDLYLTDLRLRTEKTASMEAHRKASLAK